MKRLILVVMFLVSMAGFSYADYSACEDWVSTWLNDAADELWSCLERAVPHEQRIKCAEVFADKVDSYFPNTDKNEVCGIVKSWNSTYGYGFIAGEDGEDYFIHYSMLPHGVERPEGYLCFEPYKNERTEVIK